MKKFYITLLAVLFILSTFITCSFATENSTAAEGIKNVMNGAGNTIENAGRGLVDGTKNLISNGQNMMENMTNNIGNGMENAGNTIASGFTSDNANDNNNSSYTATRTATTSNSTFLGMDPTMLTWVIMAIIGASIIGLVWYYAKEHEIDYNE